MKVRKWFYLLPVLLLIACGKGETLPDEVFPGEVLNSQDSFAVTTEQVRDIPSIDDNFRVMQGGCVTDDYAWFIIVSAENYSNDRTKEAYVIKYDRLTMEEIGRSEKLLLGHGNDVTYIPETNELYVSQSFLRRISILDADTLTVKEVKSLARGSYAIEYIPSCETVVTANGQCGMIFYDKKLNMSGSAPEQDTTLVTQGICADDNYVYHILYSTKSNTEEPDSMIFVVDREGNLITKIPIGLEEYEPENISLVGDTFYIGCNDGEGGIVFTAKLVKNDPETD